MKLFFLLLAGISCSPVLARTAADLTMLVDSAYHYSVDGSPTEKWIYLYDDNGNMIVEYGYEMEGDTWEFDSKYEYTYDSNNNQTSETYYSYSGNQVSYSWKEEYIYDANNQKIGELDYDWQDNEWKLWSEVTFEYTFDELDRLTCCTGYEVKDGDKSLLSRIEYTYDDHGNLSKEINYLYYYDRWKIQDMVECTYDSMGHQTSRTYSYDSYGGMTYDGKDEFVYDENWNIIGSTYYRWRNGEWVKYEYIVGYFSDHTTEITPMATPAHRSATRKIMNQGKIRIESQGRTFGIGGLRY